MSKFTLKVVRDERSGTFYTDIRHEKGGIDVTQSAAFAHLFPGGTCRIVHRELLCDLARLHGWEVEVTETKESKPEED